MLDINIEFTKGVLFVRLSGLLNKSNSINIENNIVNILTKSGIKFLVFNTFELNIMEETNLFETCSKIINKNGGKMIVCGNDKLKFLSASDELKALRMIESC